MQYLGILPDQPYAARASACQGRTARGESATVWSLVFGKKRRRVSEAAEASEWRVFEGEYEGSRLVTRVNDAFRDAADRPDYAIRVGVAIPLNDPDEDGFPHGAELEELDRIEDTLFDGAGPHSVLTCVVTTRSMREFVCYTRTSDWIEPFHRDMQQRIVGYEVQIMAVRDPDWSFYAQISSS